MKFKRDDFYILEGIADDFAGGGFVTPEDLAAVALSGKYSDLSGAPSLGSLATLSSVSDAQVASGANIALSKLANVAAGTDGLAAGTIQATLQSLATRIQALEDAVV